MPTLQKLKASENTDRTRRSQSQPSTGYRHSDSVSLSEKYGERRGGYEEQSDRSVISRFHSFLVFCLNLHMLWRILSKAQTMKSKSGDILSRYETEDQSEYRTDEEEAGGGRHLPQTDLEEGETEIGWKSTQL